MFKSRAQNANVVVPSTGPLKTLNATFPLVSVKKRRLIFDVEKKENVKNIVLDPKLPPKTPTKSRAQLRAEKEAKMSPKSLQWSRVQRALRCKKFSAEVVKKTQEIIDAPIPTGRRKRRSLEESFEMPTNSTGNESWRFENQQPEEANYKMQRVSNGLPDTPPNYWNVEMPSMEEQQELGLITVAESPLFKKRKV